MARESSDPKGVQQQALRRSSSAKNSASDPRSLCVVPGVHGARQSARPLGVSAGLERGAMRCGAGVEGDVLEKGASVEGGWADARAVSRLWDVSAEEIHDAWAHSRRAQLFRLFV